MSVRKWLVAGVAFAAVLVLLFVAARPERTYQGRSVSAWIRQMESAVATADLGEQGGALVEPLAAALRDGNELLSQTAAEALVRIGPAALPT